MNPSVNQKNIFLAFNKTNKNINISAVAGSGKTTVLLELLKFVPADKNAIFLAFNNSIVDELKDRVIKRDGVSIMTIHSYGWHLILNRYGNKIKMNPNKGIAKTESVLKKEKIDEKKKGWFFYIIPKILDLMRCNLINPDNESVMNMCDFYDLNVSEVDIKIAIKAFDLMTKDKSQFDFMDMIYIPVVDNSIRFKKFDYVFCDESQDFSLAQQEIIRGCLNRSGRLVTVGDSRQAIYGFAGADSNSYDKLANLNGKSIKMPLSVSYRCAKNIIKEAQMIVPEINYAFNAIDGDVHIGSLSELNHGDWILCRNLKPLIQTYLWLMKNKIKSKIRGKEIGEGILSLINKTGSKTLHGLMDSLDKEKDKLYSKLVERGVKKPSLHPKMESLCQKVEVIECLCDEVHTVDSLINLIKGIFSDEIKGIILSTIHKSKGLENDNIFFLLPELIPSIYATQPWQYEQEENLKYVAITRAKKKLVYVYANDFKNDIKNQIVI